MVDINHTYNIAVIGPEDLVSGFRALGVHVYNAADSDTALSVIKELREQTTREQDSERYGAIFVIDHLLNSISRDEYEKVTSGALPSVISIPGITSDKEANKRKLRQLTEKAIGSDILSND